MNCRYPRPDASVRMICFPWAGGGSSFYTAWGKDIEESIEVIAMCLPGRESRFKEPCRSSVKETVDEIVSIISKEYLDKPFIFFGHSMGALLAFLVSLELKSVYNKEPLHLFLSGCSAPHSSKWKEVVSNVKQMNEDQFCERLKSMGGIPQQIQDNRDLLKIYLPPIYADYCMLDEIKYELVTTEKPPLSCPIDFFDGTDDTDHNVHEWRDLTSGYFMFQTLPGGHFYIKDPANISKILSQICQHCNVHNECESR